MAESADRQKSDEAERTSLRKLWLILALIGLVVALNVVDATQGGAVKIAVKGAIGIDFVRDVPEAVAALWGIIWLTLLLGLASLVLIAHARRESGAAPARYPFRLFDLPPTRGTGLVAQLVAVLLLTGAPAWVLIHSWRTLHKHGVLCFELNKADWRRHVDLKDAFLDAPPPVPPQGPDTSKSLRLTSSEKIGSTKLPDGTTTGNACREMTDYAAPLQTRIMAGASLVVGALWLASLVVLVLPARKKGGGAT